MFTSTATSSSKIHKCYKEWHGCLGSRNLVSFGKGRVARAENVFVFHLIWFDFLFYRGALSVQVLFWWWSSGISGTVHRGEKNFSVLQVLNFIKYKWKRHCFLFAFSLVKWLFCIVPLFVIWVAVITYVYPPLMLCTIHLRLSNLDWAMNWGGCHLVKLQSPLKLSRDVCIIVYPQALYLWNVCLCRIFVW